MGMREDIMAVKKDLEEVKNEGFAMELLKDQRKQNKRLFIIILVILSFWFATIGYLVFVLNDIETVTTEETIEVEQNGGDNGNNNFINGNENEVNN